MANGPYEFISTFKTDPFEEQRIAADRQRRMAELLAQQSEQYGQYQTPRGPLGEVKYPVSQGLAQLATALGGAFKRGRAEREERELREGETAARGEANKLLSAAISGRYELPPADQTITDTTIPGETPSAQNMSISQILHAGMSGLSEEAQAFLSPVAQQLGLSEAMADQERARAREDFEFQQRTEAQYAPPPEWNTVNVREGNEQVTYAIDPTNPQNRQEIGRGAAFSPNPTTTITNNTGPSGIDYGKAPDGMAWQRGPDGEIMIDERGAPIAIPFQGGGVYEADAERARQIQNRNFVINDELDKSLAMLEANPGSLTGPGALMRIVPGSPSYELNQSLTTIKSIIGFDELQRQRAASPNGAALGQISNYENRLLQAVLGSIDQGLGDETLRYNLSRIKFFINDLANEITINGIQEGTPAARRWEETIRELQLPSYRDRPPPQAPAGAPDAGGWSAKETRN
jgi:hypothetical protein